MTTIAEFKRMAQADPPLRAPYNFVPLNVKVLESPWPEGPDHAAPHERGLCGELTVEWRLETPLLVGGRDNNSPFQFGEGGPYAIPGASLRGMIRAVLEILSYAHLGAYDDQRFSVRDYDAKTWQDIQKATAQNRLGRLGPPLAGWLSKNTSDGTYHLTECKQIDVPISDLAGTLGKTKEDWDCASLHDRHALLAANGLSGKKIDLGRVSPSLAGSLGTLVVAGLIKSEVERRNGKGGQETNKAKEVAFHETQDARSWPISQAAFEAFEAIQVKDGNSHRGPPEENWSFWKPKLDKGVRMPVFYRGDPRNAAGRVPAPTEFVMALTKLMRFPHAYTTADVTRRSQPPLLPSQLDFVEALFGRVPDEDDDKVAKPQGRQRAWRSRVRFGMAELVAHQQATLLAPQQAVTMRPRPSFYPFYLRPNPKTTGVVHPVDWSSPQAHLAGRKRYPPRNQVADLPNAGRETRRQGKAERPAQADAADARNDTNELENSLRFLDASPERPLVFRSPIRFHNLLPEELGGLIWAIGLRNPGGNENRRLRHMLGRAKAFGYGQLQAEILASRIDANTGGAGEPLAAYADAFEKWVVAGLKSRAPFTALREVAALLALCDADLGAELREALTFPRSREGASDPDRILKAYSTIRKRSACRETDRNKRTDWRAGTPVSADRGDPGRLLLPEYPLCREPES